MMQTAVKPPSRRGRGRAPVTQVVWYQLAEAPPPPGMQLSARLCAPSTVSAAQTAYSHHCFSSDYFVAPQFFFYSTYHHEYSSFRDRVFIRFTAQHLCHHLWTPVWSTARERELRVGWGGQSPARPATGPDETGGEVHTSASEWFSLTIRDVR